MLRLIQTHLASAREPDFGDRAPTLFMHRGTLDAFRLEGRNLALQVIAHEIQLMPVILFGGMDRRLSRRQGENQPTVTGVDRCEPKDIP